MVIFYPTSAFQTTLNIRKNKESITYLRTTTCPHKIHTLLMTKHMPHTSRQSTHSFIKVVKSDQERITFSQTNKYYRFPDALRGKNLI